MEKLKPEILRSFRMEMIGTGCYETLALKFAGSKPELSQKFRKMAESERSHGVMFQKCHKNLFGSEMSGEKFWLFMGKLSAVSQALLPLRIKLKILSSVEKLAVWQIDTMLSGGGTSAFHEILRSILPEEKKHAALYDEWFGRKA
jgi:rubrerythrin